jgi:hypothetical protein
MIVLILMIFPLVVTGQVDALKGSAKGFSERVLKDAQENLKSVNQMNTAKVGILLSLFYLDRVERAPKAAPRSGKDESLQDMVRRVALQGDTPEAIEAAFNTLDNKIDQRTQKIFGKMPGKAHTLLVRVSVGIWHRPAGQGVKTASLCRIALYHGSAVPESWADVMNNFIEQSKDTKLDFDDPAFKKNDEFLSALAGVLSSQMIPAVFVYGDAGSKRTFDDNQRVACQTFPSFKTNPLSGMPWKYVPADNSFQPIAVRIVYGFQPGPAKFKVKDAANFKLRSDTPDSQNLLWVAAGPNAKETAIVPVFNNQEYAVGGVNVVAYPKKVEKVRIVFLEEADDDVQEVPFGTKGLDPNKVIVSGGKDGKLDTRIRSDVDDKVVTDPATKKQVIVAGPNGVSDTYASSTNDDSGIYDDEIPVYVAEFTKQLDLLYNVVNLEWQVTNEKRAMDYDLNNNGYFDSDGLLRRPDGTSVPDLSPEEDLLRADAKKHPGVHMLYIIGQSHPVYPLGVSMYPENTSAKVYPKENESEGAKFFEPMDKVPVMVVTSLHEMGHTLGIGHTVAEDKMNTMGAEHDKNNLIFRKFQWDIMHGRSPRRTNLVTPQ